MQKGKEKCTLYIYFGFIYGFWKTLQNIFKKGFNEMTVKCHID